MELLRRRGYAAECHEVTTSDGYVLELHRIPNAGRRPVLLQNGVFQTSATWMVAPAGRSLPFLLADRGYDVWMSNSRGTTYGRRHVRLDPNEGQFWEFSWDQMGQFDIPAVVDYVLATTGRPKLSYVGYSLGCAVFFIAVDGRPDLNDKVDVMVALAPSSATRNFRNWPMLLSPSLVKLRPTLKALGVTVVLDNDSPALNASKTLCRQTYAAALLCRTFLESISGFNGRNFDLALLPVFNGVVPAGTSVDTMVQFVQNNMAGQTFQAFDYGAEENRRVYGSLRPKTYDLSRVTTPVHIFFSKNDLIVDYRDVLWLAAQLSNVASLNLASDFKFSHLDYVLGSNAKSVVYDKIFPLLPDP